MRRILLILLLSAWSSAPALLAQSVARSGQSDMYTFTDSGTLSLQSGYQGWEAGSSLSQFGSTAQLRFPLMPNVELAARIGHALISVDTMSLGSLSDAQVAFNIAVPQANLVLNAGMNLPTGKSQFEPDQLEAANEILNSTFQFNLPILGRGLNTSFGASWAYPVSRNVVLGLGAGYHIRGAFEPLSEFEYDAGDELLFIAGVDAAIGENGRFSADLLAGFRQNDRFIRVGEAPLEAAIKVGRSLATRLVYDRLMGSRHLVLSLRGNYWQDDSLVGESELVIDPERRDPSGLEATAFYNITRANQSQLGFSLSGRFFGKTTLSHSQGMIGALGVHPTFRISDGVTIPITIRAQAGRVFLTRQDEWNGAFNGEMTVGVVLTY